MLQYCKDSQRNWTEITEIDLSKPLDDTDFSFISKAFEAHRLLL